ncbi:unnamed protein product, partial [marine sediment metagenome]
SRIYAEEYASTPDPTLYVEYTVPDWLSGWDKRIELAIDDYASDIGASVTWFPVTIFLKDTNGDSTKIFEEIGNNYRKMAITQNDGTTELKGEIEGWNYDAGTPAN